MPTLAITEYALALGAYLCAIDFEQFKVKHVLTALLCMLCLKQREGAVTASLALLPVPSSPFIALLLFRPAMIRTATLSRSNVKFLKTAHYKQDMLSRAWKIKPLYLHFPEDCLLQKFEAIHGPCALIPTENINCLQSLLEHLFPILTSTLISFFTPTPPFHIPCLKIMNKLQRDDKRVDNQDEKQMN